MSNNVQKIADACICIIGILCMYSMYVGSITPEWVVFKNHFGSDEFTIGVNWYTTQCQMVHCNLCNLKLIVSRDVHLNVL